MYYLAPGDSFRLTSPYSGGETLAQKADWLHFFYTATITDTKTEALTERDLYASQLGNSALYYGIGVTSDDKQIPISVIAAAIALRRFKEESPYSPPAGVLYSVKGLKSVNGYVRTEADHEQLRDKGINVLQKFPKIGLCFSGARTLATEIKFSQINSKVALILIKNQLREVLLPLLFESSDPQGYIRREAVRRIISVLQIFYINGGLSGETPEKAFRVVEVPVVTTTTNTNNQFVQSLLKIQIKVYVRVVETLEDIEIELVNVDIIPAT